MLLPQNVLTNTLCLFWVEWGPPPLFVMYHKAWFTSPLPLRVPKQQPLLVYLCVFASWFSSGQHKPSPSRNCFSGLFIQNNTGGKDQCLHVPMMHLSSWKTFHFRAIFTKIIFLYHHMYSCILFSPLSITDHEYCKTQIWCFINQLSTSAFNQIVYCPHLVHPCSTFLMPWLP